MFCILKQSNKAVKCDSRVASSRQNLNVMVEIYHEGKTPGSVLRGPVYAHGCVLLGDGARKYAVAYNDRGSRRPCVW
jgi:hypothetical protein